MHIYYLRAYLRLRVIQKSLQLPFNFFFLWSVFLEGPKIAFSYISFIVALGACDQYWKWYAVCVYVMRFRDKSEQSEEPTEGHQT